MPKGILSERFAPTRPPFALREIEGELGAEHNGEVVGFNNAPSWIAA